MNYIRDNMDSMFFDVASSHTMFFNAYLKSIRYTGGFPKVKVASSGKFVALVNEETGEVIEKEKEG